ncbi:MAG: cytochrome c oxidase subunit II [Pseudomonadota bacterium]
MALPGTAFAQAALDPQGLEIKGAPDAGATGFQFAATKIAADAQWLDGFLHILMAIIAVFVTALLVWVIVRYNQNTNKEPATFTHNQPIEIAWTFIPVVILIFIGAFSLPVLFESQRIPEADVTIKTTGYQWYWGYEYPEHEIQFEAYMLQPEELAAKGYTQDEFRLATDTAMVIPTGQTIVVQVTAADVIHSWTVPAFGVKQDGIPGRLAELWFEVPEGEEGIYFGQCSELCGKDHAYMPITVKAVTQEEYNVWLDAAIEEYAGIPRAVTYAASE